MRVREADFGPLLPRIHPPSPSRSTDETIGRTSVDVPPAPGNRVTDGFGATLRLRVEQFAPVLGDVEANVARVAAAQRDAAADDVHLIVTPEQSLTG